MKTLSTVFDFSVKRESLINPMGKDTGFDTIYRSDNGTNLGVVSREYQLISHKEAVTTILGEFSRKKVPIEPISIEVSDHGAKLFASYRVKRESDVGIAVKSDKKVGDLVSPGFMIVNSYDRSFRFSLKAFVHRLICSNGAMVSEEMFSRAKRHTQYLDA